MHKFNIYSIKFKSENFGIIPTINASLAASMGEVRTLCMDSESGII